MDKWLTIKEFPEYEVSNTGVVRNKKTGLILKPGITNGYEQVILCSKSKKYPKYVHVLVASTFFEVDYPGMDVNHKDSRRNNNHIGNLEYLTRSENIKHGYRSGFKKPSGPHEIRKVRVKETGEIFDNATECAKGINGHRSHVSACLRGELSTHKGLHFEFVEE